MPAVVRLTREKFLDDRQGRTFADVLDHAGQVMDEVWDFFSDAGRQRRMEESEIHHDRPALAGVVREFELLASVQAYFSTQHPRQANRLRQAVGVIVRIIMEQRGWRKTGRKGCLGVRANLNARNATTRGVFHNTGGLSLWFLRAERYCLDEGMPYCPVKERADRLKSRAPRQVARVRRG
jgi:hypothetical protein